MIIEKEREDLEVAGDDSSEEIIMMASSPSLSPEEALRLQLLIISKDILLGKAAMRWETHKQYEDVAVKEIINEAERMFEFVKDKVEDEDEG